jgi:hypothetical protein
MITGKGLWMASRWLVEEMEKTLKYEGGETRVVLAWY